MIKIIPSVILFLSVIGCCQDKIIATYEIPQEAKERIPFNQSSTLSYISEQGISFSATARQKQMVVNTERNGQHSCDLIGNEIIKSSVFISVFEFGFEFILETNHLDELQFYVKRYWEDGGYQIYSTQCDELNYDPEGPFTDIEINGYTFNNVLILKTCLTDSGINQIIFSPERGVEYIDFTSGRFLKLTEN